ncbi:uncharacterized protein METZ01_LOCUS268078 [marine metagenome]|uniref:Uncharacterized protein n=1 Tax=marine metagenome TaxID=408172 RepID=A0A382JRW5_9ZZZZ
MFKTAWMWFLVACVVFVLWYFGVLTVLVHLLGVVIVFIGTLITGIGNILL